MQTEIVDQFVGQIVGKNGQYRVERLLGQSRLNAVYIARNLSDQKFVALTLFVTPEHFSLDAYQRFIQRFTTTAPALVALEHPHILRVHEFGEQLGYPYLITPYLTSGSLADLLRQQKRFSYEDVYDWLEQIVPALQYAHNRGLVHGTLKPANLVLDSQQQVLVAGFGLMHILQLSGIVQSQQPFAHLLSIAETFLVAPEYLAPEVVEGRKIDKRSDIYALGCILFELLSGTPPFKGKDNDPLAVAQMHVQQQLPSLHSLVPDLPIALASVVHQALERDPQRRFQQVSDVLEAFAQVVKGVTNSRFAAVDRSPSIQRTRNLADSPEETQTTGSWQLMPPIVTGKMPALPSKPRVDAEPQSGRRPTGSISKKSDYLSAISPRREAPADLPATNVVRQSTPRQEAREEPVARQQSAQRPPDVSFPGQPVPGNGVNLAQDAAWWTQQEPEMPLMAARPETRKSQKKAKPTQAPPKVKSAPLPPAGRGERSPYDQFRQKPASRGPNRRQVVGLVAAGGVLVAGAVVATKMNLFLRLVPQHSVGANGSTASTPTPKQQATQTGTGKQPAKKGNVVGSKTQLVNSSQQFSDPADGKSSLLIHLPDGNFVAYKQACTHEGVLVNYDPNTHTLVCPAHGAIFDPAKQGAVLQGPATTPIPTVRIQVGSDGNITTL